MRMLRMLTKRKRRRLIASVAVAAILCLLVPFIGTWLRGSGLMAARETALLERLSTLPDTVKTYAAVCAGLFSFQGSVGIMAVLSAVEYRRVRSWRTLVRELVTAAGPMLYVTAAKWLVDRPRPSTALLSPYLPNDPSFPSGHTAAAVIVGVMMVLMSRGTRLRRVVPVLAVLLVAAVGASRLVLGVHFPTDVLTSMVVCPSISYAIWQVLTSRGALRKVRRMVRV